MSGSSSKGTARRNQVNEQSGLYAEEGGYHINADNVHLKGGVIASQNAENSELSTNTLTFENIQNESKTKATSVSGGIGIARDADALYDKNGKVVNNPNWLDYSNPNYTRKEGEVGPTGGVGMPMMTSQSDSSVTKATLTEGKITLNKDSNPTQTTAKALGINTTLANANEQVENTLNLDRTFEEHQAIVSAVSNLQEAASYYMADRKREAEDKLEKVKEQGYTKDSQEYKTAEQAVKDWEIGGSKKQNVDTVTAVVGAVLGGGSTGQIGVAALSPTANNLIHEFTKDDETKITNVLAHAVLGAIEAKASGTNAASGAIAAAGAEIIANTIAKEFYGIDGINRTTDDLTASEKQNILTLSQLGSAVLGGVTGDSGYAAAVSGEIGKRAVEYNSLGMAMGGYHIANSLARNNTNCDEECKKALDQLQLDIAKAQLASSASIVSVTLGPEVMGSSVVISGSLSAITDVIGQLIDNDGDFSRIDGTQVVISTAVGIGTRNMGVLGTATTNTVVKASDSLLRKDESLAKVVEESAVTFVTTAAGGYIGKKIESIANAKLNPTRNKYEFETIYVPYPIEIQRKESMVPSILGNAADNAGSSTFESFLNNKIQEWKNEK